jgi:OOP family OmpA-OmpF porin
MQVSTELKKVQRTKDSTYEKYNLILFPFDKFVAGPINERIMKEYVYDRCQSNSTIDVEGHTDVVGLYEHNQKLSENRAKAVYEGIMKVTKGQFGHLESRGVGEDSPLYNNDLPEERFYNRTVQVKIQTPINENEK